jgi:hypothetical protein
MTTTASLFGSETALTELFACLPKSPQVDDCALADKKALFEFSGVKGRFDSQRKCLIALEKASRGVHEGERTKLIENLAPKKKKKKKKKEKKFFSR